MGSVSAVRSGAVPVSECGQAFITAQQQAGVAATAKHFPGLGSATLTVSLTKLRATDEVPYPAAVGAGVKLVCAGQRATRPGRVQRRGEPGDRPARGPVLSPGGTLPEGCKRPGPSS